MWRALQVHGDIRHAVLAGSKLNGESTELGEQAIQWARNSSTVGGAEQVVRAGYVTPPCSSGILAHACEPSAGALILSKGIPIVPCVDGRL